MSPSLFSFVYTFFLFIKNVKLTKSCRLVDFALLSDLILTIKENKTTNKYFNFAWELKHVRMLADLVGEFRKVLKNLIKEFEELKIMGKFESIQTTVLLKMARIPRRVLETWGDVQSLKHLWKKKSIFLWYEKFTKSNNNNNNNGVIVIVVENGHGDTSSNLRRDWLHFT